MNRPMECIITAGSQRVYGYLVPICYAAVGVVTGSNPVSPTIKTE